MMCNEVIQNLINPFLKSQGKFQSVQIKISGTTAITWRKCFYISVCLLLALIKMKCCKWPSGEHLILVYARTLGTKVNKSHKIPIIMEKRGGGGDRKTIIFDSKHNLTFPVIYNTQPKLTLETNLADFNFADVVYFI